MAIVEFLGHVFTSILVGYLAFTNLLADRVHALLTDDTPIVVEAPTTSEKPKTPPATISEVANRFTSTLPRVLLENKEFQRAAVLASKYSDEAVSQASIEPLDTQIANALVNIYCQYKTEHFIRTTTGTGFFIHSKGIILTNAHVAQFLLLKDTKGVVEDAECVIRSGNPASPKYIAELLYISPMWIFENADLITEETPRGTGERDYALLYVSKSVNKTPLPIEFPAVPVDTALLSHGIAGAQVLTAGYPAEALMRNGADAKLVPVLAETNVGTLYTFGSNYADIFSVTESPVGEQGASGGPIMHIGGRNVIGLIVTKGDMETEGAHSLRALTLSYIDRTIAEETGFTLMQNMQGDVALRGGVFKKAMVPFLAEILTEELKGAE